MITPCIFYTGKINMSMKVETKSRKYRSVSVPRDPVICVFHLKFRGGHLGRGARWNFALSEKHVFPCKIVGSENGKIKTTGAEENDKKMHF